MKISIITATYNSATNLQRCIDSIASQTYPEVEQIIIDGDSADNTVEIIKANNGKIANWISEKDSGIYDAINKGIKLTTGDVIGLLHSDDTLANDNVLTQVSEAFEQYNIDSLYGDLVYTTSSGKIVRMWKSHKIENKNQKLENSEKGILKTDNYALTTKNYGPTTYYSPLTTHHLLNGWMPPHPTLFVRKEIFEKYGLYRTDMKIAADYEMVLRLFYKHKITAHYLQLTTYCMTIGGASNKSLKNIFIKSSEDYRAMKMHGIPFPFKTLFLKNVRKLPQFFQ